MWELPDLFTGTAFSALTLTTSINNVPYAPQFLGSLGDRLFGVDGVRTTDIAIHERNGQLTIIGASERGAPPEQQGLPKGTMRKASVVHLAREGHMTADQVQNALNYAAAAGQPQLQTMQGLLADITDGPFGLRAAMELTHEYHRLGGIQGKVLDKDGTELHNWYDFFGLAVPADIEIDFAAFTADGGAFEVQCTKIARSVTQELEGLPATGAQIMALCGDNFFDDVYANKETKAARKNRDTGRDSDVLGDVGKAYTTFTYGGITFVNYRGTKDGTVGIATDEARLFPLGVPGCFQMLFGPPDIMGMTNMKGLPIHMYMPQEKQTSKRATVEVQSNPITICTRPLALRKLKRKVAAG